MNAFSQRVYELVATIPAGRVLTYGQVALLLGEPKRARHVGHAMGEALEALHLPCHRVVNAKGEMSPPEVFSEGMQRARLEAEGIPFRGDGRIDWKRYDAMTKDVRDNGPGTGK